ncbi:glutaredoxin family protein [Limosilactobacillus sp.]|uniref:glutaredoxin family protein n=1 Tax=Limosilactobacillus sp. TaxID=2773925 RepID=UPI003F0572C5
MKEVRIFTKQFCPGCRMTEQLMTQEGIDYQEVDVTNDHQALTALRELGYASLPVVVVDDHGTVTGWTGFRPDKIKQLAN